MTNSENKQTQEASYNTYIATRKEALNIYNTSRNEALDIYDNTCREARDTYKAAKNTANAHAATCTPTENKLYREAYNAAVVIAAKDVFDNAAMEYSIAKNTFDKAVAVYDTAKDVFNIKQKGETK